MFLEYGDFIGSLALLRPAVGMVVWRKDDELARTIAAFSEIIAGLPGEPIVAHLRGEGHDSQWFREQLVGQLQAPDAGHTWLLIHKIEEVLTAAARLLNGSREQLGRFQAVLVFVRENRRGEFQESCPDLMDWIGLRMARVDEFASVRELEDIERSIARLESKHGMTTDSFSRSPSTVESVSASDAWLWRELLAIRSDLMEERQR